MNNPESAGRPWDRRVPPSPDLDAAELARYRQITVLMVDDQMIVGESVRRMLLGEPDIAFHFCQDSLAAEQLAESLRPTLILQDLVMPQRDGLAMLERYRANPSTQQVPVVMLSTKEEPEIKAQCFALGASDYIVKLPDRVELIARIRHHGNGYLAQLQRNAAFRALEASEHKLAGLNRELEAEAARSDRLLLNILPARVAAELKRAGKVAAELHENVTVMFTDFTAFTRVAENYTPQELVRQLNECFSAFDSIVGRHGLEKLKTIGDGYLCVGGLSEPDPAALDETVAAALEIRDYCLERKTEQEAGGRSYWGVRIGIHVGPVVAGVVGVSKFAFDVWGDTVNIASRLEAAGEPGRVNVSREVYERVGERWPCQARGVMPVKNKAGMEMYFVERPLAR